MNFRKQSAVLSVCFFILCTAIISGCSNTGSDNVKTEGIYAYINVVADGGGNSVVTVDLDVGSGLFGTNLELEGGDTLTAVAGGETRTLRRSGNILDIEYKTTFGFDGGGELYRVSFIREDGTGAENSTVTLPMPFTITAPSDNSLYTVNQDIDFTWTTSGTLDKMRIDASYNCESTDTYGDTIDTSGFNTFNSLDDTGSVTYSLSELLNINDPASYDRGCDIEITVSRMSTGQLDNNYGEGGSITAKQIREIDIQYVP